MHVNTLILGAGAAGMMAAAKAGPGVLIIDHAKAPGEKIRISGGGRSNFTNMYCEPDKFLGSNPHFHKSALSRYTQWDFLDLVTSYDIAYHEKTLGQLFCDDSAKQIVEMLRAEMVKNGAELWLRTAVSDISHDGSVFSAMLNQNGKSHSVTAQNLVVATGGKSIPKMGATGLAYDIAQQFGHDIVDTRAGLVPFTFAEGRFTPLAGVATDVRITLDTTSFDEALLFTHRGLSGPAVLQISNYWQQGDAITVNLLPKTDLRKHLSDIRKVHGKRKTKTELSTLLPSRLIDHLATLIDIRGNLGDLSDSRIETLVEAMQAWTLFPQGTEGYRTAEVTLGGVSTSKISSKSMMSAHVPGLYFIGEALDVTGWLGGYNFQWAWSSAVAAGHHIRDNA